jgi:hypothetical protein
VAPLNHPASPVFGLSNLAVLLPSPVNGMSSDTVGG